MSNRRIVIASIWALGALVALAVAPVSAKEGGEARLDVAIPRDAEPGTTLEVGWSTFMIIDGAERPIHGTPVYIRFVSPDGTDTTEVRGTEDPSGSGHYVASITVPDGGIGEVIVAMIGESCVNGVCERSDYVFPLADDPLVTGAAAAPAQSATAPGDPWIVLVAVGSTLALVAGTGALLIGRTRRARVDPVGH